MVDDTAIAIARLEEKVDSILFRIDAGDRQGQQSAELIRAQVAQNVTDLADLRIVVKAVEARTADVELWRARVKGIGAVVGIAAGMVSGVIVAVVSKAIGT